MVDMQIVLYTLGGLLAAVFVIGAIGMMVHGMDRIRNQKRWGHLMFWPGCFMLGAYTGAYIGIETGTNLATILVITTVVAVFFAVFVRLITRSLDRRARE